MIERYSLPEMARIWDLQSKYAGWLRVELAVLQVKERYELVPTGTFEKMEATADFSVERITELDEGPGGFHHDLLAFVESCKETMQSKGVDAAVIAHFHKDVTSYDIEDSAFVLQIRQATDLIITELKRVIQCMGERALAEKYTPMIALTHGQAAEINSLGLKLLNYYHLLIRDHDRLTSALQDLAYGRLAGAVGNYGHLGPELEEAVCEILGLETESVSTQILHRAAHANLFNALVVLASDVGHVAHNLWLMCQFPRQEAREGFKKGQRGSSQMPHKRNPHKLERLRGLAAQMRGYQGPIMEMIATADERAIDQSSVERISWADGCILLHYMVDSLRKVVADMEFFPNQMQANVDRLLGVWASGHVKDLILSKGVSEWPYQNDPQPIYRFVQSCAFEAWEQQVHLREVLGRQGLGSILGLEELESCFDQGRALQHVDEVFSRFPAFDEDISTAP